MPPLDRKTKDKGIRLAEARGTKYFSGAIGKVELHRFLNDSKVDRVEVRDIEPDAMTIERPDQGFTLFLKSSRPRVRHRFSVAHELAHLLLTPVLGTRVVHRRRFAKKQDPFGDQVEFLCNDMAAAILMPASHVDPLMSDNGYSARCVPEIARTFDTSFEAASRRFVDLNKGCCGLIVWRRDGRRIYYQRSTVWNQRLGYCYLTLDQRRLSDGFDKTNANFNGYLSTRESIIVTRGRNDRMTRRVVENVSVESFRRKHGQVYVYWSFVSFRGRP